MRPDATDSSAPTGAGGEGTEAGMSLPGQSAHVQAEAVIGTLAALKDEGYESLVDMFGCDTGESIELTYHLRSYAKDRDAYVKTVVPYDAEVASVWNVYPGALMPERETAELLGLHLAGHPNPRRLLTTDGVPPLLRRSVAIRSVEEVKRR